MSRVSGFAGKRVCGFVLFILMICSTAVAEDWKELKGEHFLIYYLNDKKFAEEALAKAERCYSAIVSDFGFSRYDNFWQWDNRAKIYIYRDREAFLRTGAKSWATAAVIYDKKEIMGYEKSGEFINSFLPHEITHLIFRDYVGFKSKVPLWLDEGVAQWEEKGKADMAAEFVRGLIRENTYIPLSVLTEMDVRQVDDPGLSFKFYAEAATVVGYLIKERGASKFTLFCRELRDGKSVDEALSSAYTGSIGNIGELQDRWVKYYAGG